MPEITLSEIEEKYYSYLLNMNINSVNNDMSTTILTNNVDLLHLFAPKMRKGVKVEPNN